MNATSGSGSSFRGFTLVELLVALVILASLVTVTSVSVETAQIRARADKTASMGRRVVEDLERSDGLSFVSDFGRLPQNADELKFLFSRNVTDTGLVERTAAAYQILPLVLPENADLSPSEAARLAEAFGNPTLGIGWRGPYSLALELRAAPGEASGLEDGWGNQWQVLQEAGGISGLRSPGRDGVEGGVDWQDRDLDFPLRRNLVTENIEVLGQIRVRSANGVEYSSDAQFTNFVLKLVYFTPGFASNFASGEIVALEFTWRKSTGAWTPDPHPTRPETASDNPFLFRLRGLAAGHRAFFVYAVGTPTDEVQPRLYGGGVRIADVAAGTNRMEFTLTEL